MRPFDSGFIVTDQGFDLSFDGLSLHGLEHPTGIRFALGEDDLLFALSIPSIREWVNAGSPVDPDTVYDRLDKLCGGNAPEFLCAAYRLGVNPLPGIRRALSLADYTPDIRFSEEIVPSSATAPYLDDETTCSRDDVIIYVTREGYITFHRFGPQEKAQAEAEAIESSDRRNRALADGEPKRRPRTAGNGERR